ncbi:hypothetical protein ACIQUB_07125 [Rhizobium sp. NPDC090275]|uniref:hypothetical protein n=1 Tax=Rhizobium sp. NPDC090275 TaxID=3364498 RepID=UPI00383AF3C6
METVELIERLIATSDPQDKLMHALIEALKEHHGATEAVLELEAHMLKAQEYRTSLIVEATVLESMELLKKRRRDARSAKMAQLH